MPEENQPVPRAKLAELMDRVDALEKSVKQAEKFAKDLITALQEAEKGQKNLFLLPQGTYYGITIE